MTKLFVNLTLRKALPSLMLCTLQQQDMLQYEEHKRWKTLGKGRTLPSFPRKTAVDLFRELTGLNCLQNHLYRIKVVNSKNCLLCDTNEPMTFENLNNCIALSQFSHCQEELEGL